jgi:hypothetical protein
MERFPGRTLEELDGLDWFRLMRALDAQQARDVERKRSDFLNKKLGRDGLTEEDWKLIAEHDELVGEITDG